MEAEYGTMATTGMTQCPDCDSPLLDPPPRTMFPECQEAGMILTFCCGREDGASGTIADPTTWSWRQVERPAACRVIADLRMQLEQTQQEKLAIEAGYDALLAESNPLA